MPHHHVGGIAARRDDGDAQVRPSGHRGFRRCQARTRPAQDVQPVGAGHRPVHAGGQGRCGVGPGVRRHGLPHRFGARAVGQDHARDVCLCRTRRDLHRPHQQPQQPALLRNHSRHQPVRRAAAAALWRMPSGFGQSGASGQPPVRGRCRSRCARARRSDTDRGAHDGQRRRRFRFSARRTGARGEGQAPHRTRHHRSCRRADHVRRALRFTRSGAADGKMAESDAARGVSGVRRPGPRKGCVSAVRQGQVPGRRNHPRDG